MLQLIKALTALLSAAVQIHREPSEREDLWKPLKTLLQLCVLLLSFLRGHLLSREADRSPARVCLCVCVLGFLETAPPHCEAESRRQQVQLTHIGFLPGGGQRGREQVRDNSGEITGRLDRTAEQCQSFSAPIPVGDSEGNGTRRCSGGFGVDGVCE